MRSLILYFIEHEHKKVTKYVPDSNIKMLFPLSITSLITQYFVNESVERLGQTVADLLLLRFYIVVWIGNIIANSSGAGWTGPQYLMCDHEYVTLHL